MSNKRNPRRKRQRIRSEVDRKAKVVTKSMAAFVAAQLVERERKEQLRYWNKPTKAERRRRELEIRRWRNTPRRRRRERLNPEKRRRVYGKTWWSHSHDV